MKTFTRLLSVLLAVVMLFALAACGGTGNNNSKGSDATSGVRYDDNGDLLYKPEDVGELSNPIVKGLISPAPDDAWYAQEIGWKEEAYGIEYDMDTCAWAERDMKWVAAYVGGTAYDTLTRVNFPTTAVKGLLEPMDEHLPVEDDRYFNRIYMWNGLTYGVQVKAKNYTYRDCGELYGVWYNNDLFEDNGLTTPLEMWENGEWTIPNMIELAKELTIDVDSDGVNDTFGYGSTARQLFTIGNGARTVEFTDTGIDLVWDRPEYIRGLEYANEISAYSTNGTPDRDFPAGKIAMYGERIQCSRYYSKSSPDCNVNFDAVWVPFPKGEDGEGYMGSISTGSEAICIGKGSKNIEGAKVFICADIGKFDYVEATDATMMMGVDEDTLARALSCEEKLIKDYYNKIGTLGDMMYQVWTASRTMGVTAAIEKFTPSFQNQINILVSEKQYEEQEPYKAPENVDFENDALVLKEVYENTLSITTDASEVISGSKSLKIQLAPDNEYGPVAYTTKDDYSMPFGGNYKISFKAKAVGGEGTKENTLLVEFRPSAEAAEKSSLNKVSGYRPVDLSTGDVVDVSFELNITNMYDDLQVVLIGNTDEKAPNLAIIIDDFKVEKIG